MKKTVLYQDGAYTQLIHSIDMLLCQAKEKIAGTINSILVETYWNIGKYIVEYEQKGQRKAEYGSKLIDRLASDLTQRYGKGFGRSNLIYIRKLYTSFPIGGTLSHQLSWSHYYEILKANDPLEISFYTKTCEQEKWSVRELKRQMKSLLFHRLVSGKNKDDVLKIATEGIDIQKPEDVIKDPFVLEFLGLPRRKLPKETDIETALVNNLSRFMLELGKGFSYIGKQYHFCLAGRHYYVDLVFYNVILKCYCLIDLKRGDIQHEDVGQMNFYLNFFRHNVCKKDDNEPFGIILGTSFDKLTMKYAIDNMSNQLFISRYQLYLPDRESLEKEFKNILSIGGTVSHQLTSENDS
ncbi:MAG: PDDEXK nuclease domain-containing protein [Bacteroidales bacterium]|nr:PDDEXK nuclease domain-containing protein [Bacteroidales bacterium]